MAATSSSGRGTAAGDAQAFALVVGGGARIGAPTGRGAAASGGRVPFGEGDLPIERLLRDIGNRQLDPGMLYDGKDNLRLIYPVPDWEDYVSLAVSEIRLYGANSIQVPRRLLACLEHLIEVLPTSRAPALRRELLLLEKAVKREFVDIEDQKRMSTGDRQGLGGTDAED